jgi:hypothetical protein
MVRFDSEEHESASAEASGHNVVSVRHEVVEVGFEGGVGVRILILRSIAVAGQVWRNNVESQLLEGLDPSIALP